LVDQPHVEHLARDQKIGSDWPGWRFSNATRHADPASYLHDAALGLCNRHARVVASPRQAPMPTERKVRTHDIPSHRGAGQDDDPHSDRPEGISRRDRDAATAEQSDNGSVAHVVEPGVPGRSAALPAPWRERRYAVAIDGPDAAARTPNARRRTLSTARTFVRGCVANGSSKLDERACGGKCPVGAKTKLRRYTLTLSNFELIVKK
jgi:hypothetical protein